MIVASLSRSAAIAWDSRPRVSHQPATVVSEPDNRESIAKPQATEPHDKKGGFLHKRLTKPEKHEETAVIPPPRPVWGDICHDGWASPTSPDLPNLQYTTVILELPHLIEARAVSLAPTDPESSSDQPMPDMRVVQLLQRPASMGLRDYLAHLTGLNIIISPFTAAEFVDAYEYARFGTRALSEYRFRDLMKQLAELLRSMVALDPTMLLDFDVQPESDIDDDATSSPTPITPRSRSLASSRSVISRTGSEGTIRTTASRRVPTAGLGRPEFSTAPATPRSRRKPTSRSPSANSFAQSRVPYQGCSSSSNESLRSISQGSVIKLNMTNDEGSLPYTLNLTPSQ
ncbi:hypothetical protein BJ875DRAFT_501380 [Amylocarpus encephaloides]|uniref:Defect at low temperature protein 1 n=1 Tax=Amylocarpus encephaloides TaxID=45428 RepID=A0A9P7YTL4_9HELO|nr:hypothetical protein BJ875DRAFT_501380 [Amylocarpus encephaloides]